MTSKIKLLLILLIFALNSVFPEKAAGGAGSTSFEFLLLPVGARETAIAAGSAIALNPNAFWWNPAGLAYVERTNIDLTYNRHFEEIAQQRGGFTFPLQNCQVAAVNATMLSVNGIEGYGWFNTPSGDVVSKGYTISYSQAKVFNRYLAGGLSLKGVFEQLEEESSYGAALDAGFLINPYPDFQLSGGVKNAGIAGEFIEEKGILRISFFGGLGMKLNRYILFAGEINYINDEISFGAGVEFNLWNLLFIRGGYSNFAGETADFSLGGGWSFKDIALDYTMAPYKKLGPTHRVDLNFKFGEPILIEKLYRNAKKYYSRQEYRKALVEFNKVKSLNRHYKQVESWLQQLEEKEIFTESAPDAEKTREPSPEENLLNSEEPAEE